MEKRYFLWFTVAFLFGIFLASKNVTACYMLAGMPILAGICLYKYRKTKFFCSLLIGFVVGTFCFLWNYSSYEKTIGKLAEQSVTVEGRIVEISEGERLRLLVRGTIRGEGIDVQNAGVYVYPQAEDIFAYGDVITVGGYASVPTPPRNFGDTDYRLYCMGKDVQAFLYPKSEDIRKRGNDVSRWRVQDIAYTMRTAVQDRLSGRMSAESEGFLRAYLTGDKSLMFSEAAADLNAVGLSHIVAVSGVHLQVILSALMLFFGILQIKKRAFSIVFYLLFIWFFVLFTGASASVLRAALMMTLFFFAGFFRRDNDSLTALAFAAFSMCAVNPGTLFDVGFQLSCASTCSILIFGEKFNSLFPFLPRFLRRQLSMFLAACIGFLPLTAMYFGTYCTVGVLANLLVSPVVSPILVVGFIGVALSGVPLLSDIIFFFLDMGVRYILGVASFFAEMPYANITVRKPGVLALGGYIFLAASLFFLLSKMKRRSLYLCTVALAFIAVELTGVWILQKTVTVTFLSVGNGDCALITSREGTVLIDSGGSLNTDVARNTVEPYLRRQGIGKVDAAFLTHYHIDHGGAYVQLLEDGMIRTLYLPYHADMELKRELEEAARKAETNVRYLGDGDVIRFGKITVASFDSKAGSEENNGLVYRLEAEGTRLLFTGDIDKEGARRLVFRGADIDCDVIKVPHHGASTSVLPEFTEATSPDIAVISCGKNSYGHPHQKALTTYTENCGTLLRTDQNGTVRIYLLPGGVRHVQTLR